MVKQMKVSYDEENDILWVHSGEKVKDSLAIDNYVVDFSYDDKIIGVQIFDASIFINNLRKMGITKDMLANIKTANLNFVKSKELTYIVIYLEIPIHNKIEKISFDLSTPQTVLTCC